jgi:hypothetical protein
MSSLSKKDNSATLSSLAVAWAALGKVADKEGDRSALPPGSTHKVNLAILGEVDGNRVSTEVFAELTVGHDSVRAASSTPNADHVLALILGRLGKTMRERILRELPEEFAQNGDTLPAADESLIEAAGGMLKRLRAKISQPVKGSVACKYQRIDDVQGNAKSGNAKSDKRQRSSRRKPVSV